MTTHKKEGHAVPWSTCYVLLTVGELELVSVKAILSRIGMTDGFVESLWEAPAEVARRFAHDMTFIATNTCTHMSATFPTEIKISSEEFELSDNIWWRPCITYDLVFKGEWCINR